VVACEGNDKPFVGSFELDFDHDAAVVFDVPSAAGDDMAALLALVVTAFKRIVARVAAGELPLRVAGHSSNLHTGTKGQH